jgi:hypothetical protein
MKGQVLLILISFIFSISTSAQSGINGRIMDTYDYGVAFANVLLLNEEDSSFVKGTVTDEDGYYALANIAPGGYVIESYMIGFSKSYSDLIQLEPETTVKVDPIILAEESQELEEVVIKADKPLYEMEMGKMVVNVPSSITSAGQSVIDVLEKSPGVFVNRQNNTLALNGKGGVIVLMNGKRSRMPITAVYQLLEGLNAGDIEKIEIMSVPPAKYDADGDAGFINIVMKRGNDVGTNGSVMANLGYASGPRAGTSLNLSHQAKKLSFYGNYSFNYVNQEGVLNMYREADSNTETMQSSSEAVRHPTRKTHNFQFGMDYYLTDKTIIGVLTSGYSNKFQMTSETIGEFQYSISPDTTVLIGTEETNHWRHLMGNINIQHTFNKGQMITANLDYLTYDNSNPTQYNNRYYDEGGSVVRDYNTRVKKETPIDIWVAKLDYSLDLSEKIRMETGLKGAFTTLVNEILFEEKIGEDWIKGEYFSNYADLTEDVLAAFVSMKIKFDEKTSLNAGLRYEHTTTLLSTDEDENAVDRSYGDFFPSVFVSHKINDNNLLQFSYGRRITRPTFNELAPFVFFMDPYTYTSGNADLLPTYTHSIKGDYSFKNFIFSLQFSHDNNAIFRFQPEYDPQTNVMVLRTDNVDRRETVSLLITLPFQVTDWWEMQNNLSGNWQRISTQLESFEYRRDQNGFQFNTTQTFRLPKKYTIELSGFYVSPSVNGYFNWLSRGFVNMGIQKEFNNEGALRFSCNDIFETAQMRWESQNETNFSFHGNIKFEKRIFTLTYTQKFGNKKIKGIRKRSVGSEEERRRVTN